MLDMSTVWEDWLSLREGRPSRRKAVLAGRVGPVEQTEGEGGGFPGPVNTSGKFIGREMDKSS